MSSSRFFAYVLLLGLSQPAASEVRQSAAGPMDVIPVIEGLETPWALGFLPNGELLVTERDGALLHIAPDGARTEVRGLPRVVARGQGGLLDVLVPKDFATSREVFLSFSTRQGMGSGTALGRGRLSADGARLEGFETIFELEKGSSGGRHFGSRIVEGDDRFLYLTIGDRGDRPSAQDLSNQNGSVVRVARDGRVPSDNPFVGQAGARAEIWSYGHRNPQGAALDARGQLWTVEHGAAGGDEVNLIKKGANYGWPVISYGTHYSGGKIGEGTEKAGMEQPAHYWDPSIAPSGMVILENSALPMWEGSMLVGSLKFGLMSRLDLSGDKVREVERIEWPETARVRDLRQGPNGALWIISEGNGAIYRVTPASGG